MEKISCKSCGGTLQKVGPANYKCMFCGTMHQLELDDTDSVRALLEENNRRWLHINKSMDIFFNSINRASVYKFNLRKPWLALAIVSALCVIILISLGFSLHNHLADTSRGLVMKDSYPFLAIGGVMLVLDGYFLAGIFYGRWKLKKMLEESRGIIMDVLQTYRQMSEKPAKDMLWSLHDPTQLMDYDAVQTAFDVYNQALSRFEMTRG